MTAATERLAASRAAIAAALRSGGERGDRVRDQDPSRNPDPPPRADKGAQGSPLRQRLRHAWEAHPAHLAVEIAAPLVSRWAGRRPLAWLALAALGGAAVVLSRPWRMVSASGVALLALRATGVPTLALSLLRPRRPGADPHASHPHA